MNKSYGISITTTRSVKSRKARATLIDEANLIEYGRLALLSIRNNATEILFGLSFAKKEKETITPRDCYRDEGNLFYFRR